VLASTQVYRRSSNDIEEWVTPVNLQITCKHVWREGYIAPKLAEIRMQLGLNAPAAPPTLAGIVIQNPR
jgi:hypothetical protein